jgi:hypothetical protein
MVEELDIAAAADAARGQDTRDRRAQPPGQRACADGADPAGRIHQSTGS